MHYIGVDLAWGEKKPTGIAVLDADGRLLHVSTRTTDEDVLAGLAAYTRGPCLVAIDAPLVVANPDGARPCERALNRDFSRFDAGAHPANTGKPEFSGTPRGARLAGALKLDIDPASRRRRRAIEVYPHPATVALFGLGRTLKYKQRAGRTVASLREALTTLMGHLESLRDASVPLLLDGSAEWEALVAAVRAATRKSELRRVEDQVDAVVCAYVARFADARPEAMTTYGDLATGYIVTPSLPEGLVPSPRPLAPAATADPVRAAVDAYAAAFPELTRATQEWVALVTEMLDEAGINYLTVTGRTKSVASFAGKAGRTTDGQLVFTDPLTQITDQVGVRVITYVLDDVRAVADLLADQLVVLDDRDMTLETVQEGRFGYSSRHVLVRTGPEQDDDPRLQLLRDRPASVQVRTVLQHAWAEFEHDIRYKGTVPEEHTSDLDRRFTLAAGLLELADREFAAIRERLRDVGTQAAPADEDDPRIDAQDLAAYLAGRFPEAGWSRTDHYAWISGLLLELGITSLRELGEALLGVDSASLSARMGYKYPPGAVRRLDDALLATFGERYVDLQGNAHRAEALATRLARLRE